MRIGKIFELDARFRDGSPTTKVKALRATHIAPLAAECFVFAHAEDVLVRSTRGFLRRVFGYVVRHCQALERFIEDARLRLDNKPSESELRRVVIVRDAALFAGSDQRAASAGGHVLSPIASARQHRLDREAFLAVLCDNRNSRSATTGTPHPTAA